MCLTMSCDIKTLSLSELYGKMLNHEQTKQLKKNLVRDTKDTKSTSVALIFESIPSVPKSLVVITELDPFDSECLSENDSAELDESIALLTNTFRRFAHKSNFQKPRPLSLTNKPKSTPVDKAVAICYINCQGKGVTSRLPRQQYCPLCPWI